MLKYAQTSAFAPPVVNAHMGVCVEDWWQNAVVMWLAVVFLFFSLL